MKMETKELAGMFGAALVVEEPVKAGLIKRGD